MDYGISLVDKLDKARPDKPSCRETAVRDSLDEVSLAKVEKGRYKGLSYVQAAALRILELTIEDPSQKGAASLGDIARLGSDRKAVVEHEAGTSLRDLFRELDQEPERVVVVGEGE